MNPTTQERLEGLLYANIFGSLTAEEKDELYAASLDNQIIFNQLMEVEDLRSALETKESREQLLTVMGKPIPSPSDGILAARSPWFTWWTLSWSLGGACAAVLVLLLARGYEASRTSVAADRQIAVATKPGGIPDREKPEGTKIKENTNDRSIEPAGVRAIDPLPQIFGWQPQLGLGAGARFVDTVEAEPIVSAGTQLEVRVTSPVAARVWLLEQIGDDAPSLVTTKDGVFVEAETAKLIAVTTAEREAGVDRPLRGTLRMIALDAGDRLFDGDGLNEAGQVAPRTVVDLHFSISQLRTKE